LLEKEKNGREMHLFMLWRKAWNWKWILLISSVSAGILSLIVSLILPKAYEAKVTILAPESVAGGIAGGLIAQAAGLGIEGEISSQTVLALLNSGAETEAVIENFNIIETFGLENKSDAYELLEKITDFSIDQLEGIIRVKVETHSPKLSAEMANFYVNYLNTLNEQIEITTEKPIVKVIDWASIPSRPSKPRIKWNTAIGIFLGFIVSFVVLYVRDTMQDYWT
jgi:uncharacterized protein involved in exopolysaccharide biosynthesis